MFPGGLAIEVGELGFVVMPGRETMLDAPQFLHRQRGWLAIVATVHVFKACVCCVVPSGYVVWVGFVHFFGT